MFSRVNAAIIAAIMILISAVSVHTTTLQAQETEVDNWSGFSVSLGGGASNFDPKMDVDVDRFDFGFFIFGLINGDNTQSGQQTVSENDWKAFGTAQIAFDQKIGNFVIGAFADLDFGSDNESSHTITGSDVKNCRIIIFPVGCPVPPNGMLGSVEIENGKMWSVGGRLGFLVTPTWLVYGLVAYSEMDVDVSASIKDPFSQIPIFFVGNQPTNVKLDIDKLTGVTFGGGTEFQIAQNLHFKIEYRYTEFDSESATFSNQRFVGNIFTGQFIDENVRVDLDSEVHSIRGAIVLKFGNI